MTAWGLAWRTIAHNPTRAVLAVGGVAVIGALLFNMLLLSRGLLVSFRDLLDTGGHDIRVMASEGSPVHREPIANAASLAGAIGRLPEVQGVALLRTGPATAISIGSGVNPVAVTLVGSTEGAIGSAWQIVKGSNLHPNAAAALGTPGLPPAGSEGGPAPVLVSTRLADLFRLVPGSTLRLRVSIRDGRASALPALDCRVAGVGTFQFESTDDFTVATTMKGFSAAHGETGREEHADLILVASKPASGPEAAARAIQALRPDVRVYSNAQLVEQFNAHAFSYFRQISVVLSSMTLAFAFLLVATLLTMSVNQRLGEVAALRALGFSRRRIAMNLLCESALLVGMGGIAALPIGAVLAVVLDGILRGMPGVPERLHFFVFEPRTLALHAALLATTGFLAALYPIWLAARLPIAATLRREIVS